MQDRKTKAKCHKEKKLSKGVVKKKSRSAPSKLNEGYEADDEEKLDEFSLAYQQVSLQVSCSLFFYTNSVSPPLLCSKDSVGDSFCFESLYEECKIMILCNYCTFFKLF